MMADAAKRTNLGRGLSALLGDADEVAPSAPTSGRLGAQEVAISSLRPNQYQPRQIFNASELSELTESVREKGILQPILVRPTGDPETPYEIVAGERRWRAAQQAQLHQVPIIIRELGDEEALEWALIENLQREDLNALEEAEGYRRLMDEFSHTQEALAQALGKSRSHVANTMRLLNLPEAVKGMLQEGDLSPGHARALLKAGDPIKLAKSVVRRGLNVRQTEKLVQGGDKPSASKEPESIDPNTAALENDVSSLLGLGVKIKFRGEGGTITVTYDTLEQLDEILHRLSEGAHGHSIKRDEEEIIDALLPENEAAAAAEDLSELLSEDEPREDESAEEGPDNNNVVATEELSELLPDDVEDAIAQMEESIANDDDENDDETTDHEFGDLSLSEADLGDLINEADVDEQNPLGLESSEEPLTKAQ